jgi:hypothetical protein
MYILYHVGGTCRIYRLHHSIVYNLLLPTPLVSITIIPYSRFWPPDVISEQSLDVLSTRRLAADCLGFSLAIRLTASCRTLRMNLHSWLLKYLRSDGLYFRCVGNVGIRNQLLHSSVNNSLPSHCLGMDAPSICSIGKSVTISSHSWHILCGHVNLFLFDPQDTDVCSTQIYLVHCSQGT